MRASRFVAFALALSSALSVGVAKASPQDLFGFGARASGMANTGVAFADTWESVYLNPAGLARARRKSVVFGVVLGGYDLNLDGERFAAEPITSTTIGAVLPLPFGGVLENRLALGVGFYTPTNIMIAGSIGLPDAPQFLVLNRAQSSAINVSLGFDFHDWIDGLRVGGGVSALGSFAGSVVAGIDATGRFGSTVETQVLASFAPIFGAQYDHRDFSFGLVYRGRIESRFEFNVVATDLPLEVPRITIGGLAQYDPDQVGAEVAWRPLPELQLALGATYKLWSDYPGPTTRTSASSDDPPPVNFHDTLTPRVAGEYTVTRRNVSVAFRLGYAYDPTPAPRARAEARYLDGDRHTLFGGFGLEVRFTERLHLTLDGFAQASVMPSRTHDAPQAGRTTNMVTDGALFVGGWQAGLTW
jgi:long-subunit fatty acid transport protein